MTEQEAQLLHLLRSVMDADQVELAQAKQAAMIVEAEVAELNNRHQSVAGGQEVSSQMQADKHRLWIKQKIAQRSIALAAAMATLGAAEAQLRNSFGRYNAFKMYLDEQGG